jgi:drug/metabolite transporter (DMT)-like permease
MKKSDMPTLVPASVFGIAAVILSFYGDTVGVSMMAAAGIALSSNYFLRKLIHKDKVQKDEMTKRISSITSEFALFVAIATIGILTIILHFFPMLFDVFEVLGILIAVIITSKIAFQLYYEKIKKEIGF